MRQLFELHRRFGLQVTEVLAEAFRRHAGELAEGKLPEHCLVRLAAAPDDTLRAGGITPQRKGHPQRPRSGSLASALTCCSTARTSSSHSTTGNELVVIEGLKPLAGDQMFPLFEFLVELRDADVAQRRRDENYTFVASDKLAEKLQFRDEGEGLRALIYRTRRRICEAAEDAGAPALSRTT